MRFALIAAFAASALAAPGQLAARQAKTQYNLQTKSDDPKLNNQYLGAQGGIIGLFGKQEKFYTTKYDSAQTLSLHVTDDTHQIALRGSNGLLDLVDVVNPTAEGIPQGQAMEWSTFVIDGQGNVNVKDGQEIPTRRWVAYANTDGSSGVALYDGVTVPQQRQLANVTIVAVAAQ